MNQYPKFGLMIAVSTATMLVLMYLNTYSLADVFFSQTRTFMALIMGAAMTVIMLAFMQKMYPNRNLNRVIYGASVALFIAALALVRTQATVDDVSYMKAMIPHHSIAILTSSRAHIADPRARKLADGIIQTQRKEIGEMNALIRDIEAAR